MRAKAVFTLLCRVLLIALCGFAVWRSIRIAIADWLASAGTIDGFERAARFAPDNAELLAREAMYRNGNGDLSPAVDQDLRRAARLNPLDSAVLMTLGLREEFRGNSTKAEGYLVRAAEIDHQFKPAWTLANYYYRANQPDKGWPMIRRMLSLEPLTFDPAPVFELCWNQTTDAHRILSLIPKRGHRPIQYLEFLIKTRRTDAALDVFPEALVAADPADSSDIGTLTGFTDFLAGADRMPEAVTVWNRLVERGILHSGRLDPAKGISIADPDFKFTALPRTFGWRMAEIPGVFASWSSGSLRFEISGDEPQSFQVLSVFAPVLASRPYHLVWKSDGSSLNSPQDPGFRFQIVQQRTLQQTGEGATQCPPLLSPGKPVCDFIAPAPVELGHSGPGSITRVRIDLGYTRAQGTTRVSGTLQLFNARLELAR